MVWLVHESWVKGRVAAGVRVRVRQLQPPRHRLRDPPGRPPATGRVEVWWTPSGIDYGDRWEHVIRDKVDACAAMIVVMSPAAEASPHVGNELERARQQGKPILPVLLSGDAFFALGTVHRFDARDGELPDDAVPVPPRRPRLRRSPAGTAKPVALRRGGSWWWVIRRGRRWPGRTGPTCSTRLVASAGGGGRDGGVGAGRAARGGQDPARRRVRPVADPARLAGDRVGGRRNPGRDRRRPGRAGHRGRGPRARTRIRRPPPGPRCAGCAPIPGPCLLVYDNAVDADLIRAWTPSIGSVHTVVTTTHRELDGLGRLVDVTLFTPRRGRRLPASAHRTRRHRRRPPARRAPRPAAAGPGPGRGAASAPAAATPATADTCRPWPGSTPPDCCPAPPATRIRTAWPKRSCSASTTSPAPTRPGSPPAARPPRRARPHRRRPRPAAPPRHRPSQPNRDRPPERGGRDRTSTSRWRLTELAAVLTGRSLTVPADDNDHLVVHRLVQRVVRERAHHTGTLDTIIAARPQRFRRPPTRRASSGATGRCSIEYADHGQTLLTHATGDHARRQILLLLRPAVLAERSLHPRHRHRHRPRPGHRLEQVLGADHPDTLTSRNNLAGAYQSAGRLDEAIALYTRTLTDRERVLGADHPDTLTSRNNLARAYQDGGPARRGDRPAHPHPHRPRAGPRRRPPGHPDLAQQPRQRLPGGGPARRGDRPAHAAPSPTASGSSAPTTRTP